MVRDVVLAILVQALMLVQVSLSYAWLWIKYRYFRARAFAVRAGGATPASVVSVIVPAYREKGKLGRTLRHLFASAATRSKLEVIVVDAGGEDGTMDECQGLDVRIAESTGGRGPAVAAGARIASGEILIVVHADTLVPPSYDDLVRTALARDDTLATAFRFRVDRATLAKPEMPFLVMESTVHVRATTFQLPFGDQALGITKANFVALGGLDDLARVPMLEDYILVQRLRQLGAQGYGFIKILDPPALCDARRWVKSGVWRVNFTNQRVMLLYTYAGYTPADIFQLYYGKPKAA